MPEGDTIARAAAALERAQAGQRITRFATGLAHLARVDDDAPIRGRTIQSWRSRGKHLLLTLSGDLVLRTHMRMHGSWHLYRPGERWQRPARAARIEVETANWLAVAFDVPVAEFLMPDALRRTSALNRLSPDLASPSFDRQEAIVRLRAAAARPIGEVLLDQRVMAGIGNVFRSELLFLVGLHPHRPVSGIDDTTLGTLVDHAVRLLVLNSTPSAPPRRTTTGRAAKGESLWVYARTTQPCRRCGAAIQSAAPPPDARRVYWCPACQSASGC
jgi:endonuclease-8